MKIKTQKGFIEPYDMQRIVESLESDVDFAKTQGVLTDLDGSHIRRIAKRVTTKLDKMLYEDDDVISSDTIRGLTVSELMADGEDQVANVVGLVGLHPKRIFEIINGAADNDNANLQHNPETTHKIIADEVSKKYYLGQLPQNLSHLHLSGDLHIHDLEYFGTRLFCQDWDLRYFFYYGLMPDGEGTRASVSGPAKNPEVAILHAVKALSAAQTNFAGGQGFYNFLTFLAPYLEGLSYPEIYQLMQMFVYEMTQMMVARGGQVVFSSVQLTPGVPLLWRDKPAVFKGKVWSDRTYGEFEREVRLAFKALMEVMIAGDYWGKPFNFPKPEIAIEPEFIDESTWTDELIVDDEIIPSYKDLYGLAFELTAKFGTPYFDNMIPAYRGHSKGGVACYQCCAYNFQVDPLTDPDFESKMQFKNGAHFSMGSSQVVTLNVPRAAYYASEGLTTESRTLIFINRLKSLMAEACKVFKFKKSLLEPLIAGGRVPFATQRPKDPATREAGTPAADLDAMVWTIGIVGMNEAIEVICGKQLHEDDHAVDIARRVMTELKLYCYELTAEYGFKIALARTPAETVAQRFAVLDLTDDAYHDQAIRVVKGDVTAAIDQFCSGSRDLPIYYTNGCMLPSDCDNIYQRLTTESKFFPLVDGGDIFHVWLGEANTDPGALMDFAMRVATKTDIGYFAFTKDLTVCRDCGTTGCGLYDSCCRCKSPNVDYVSRITGYMSSVSGWNAAKRQELEDRRRVSI